MYDLSKYELGEEACLKAEEGYANAYKSCKTIKNNHELYFKLIYPKGWSLRTRGSIEAKS